MEFRRTRIRPIAVAAVVLLSAAGTAAAVVAQTERAAAAPVVGYPGLVSEPVLTNLGQGVDAKFAPDGRIYVAVKTGMVLSYSGPGDASPVTTLDIRQEVYDQSDRGLLGIALDPSFDQGRPYIYVLYTYDRDPFGDSTVPRWGTAAGNDTCPTPPGATVDGCTASARLTRYTVDARGVADPASRLVLLDGAGGATGGWCDQFSSHSIGTVAFGPDGMLYVGAGDGASYDAVDWGQFGGSVGSPTPANPCNDQPGGRGTALTPATTAGGALRSQAVRVASATGYVSWDGAILRIDPNTGQAAAGNPLLNNGIAGDDRIVAYGLRNPYRFGFRPNSDQLWLGDVGFKTWEEVDQFSTGPTQTSVPNFGWPCYEGDSPQASYAADGIGLCQSLYAHPVSTLGGVQSPLTAPVFAWPRSDGYPATGCASSVSGSASTGGQFVNNPAWPQELQGAYVFGDFARGCIVAMLAGADGQPDPNRRVALVTSANVVDIETGPDGDLYYIDVLAGTLNRLRPVATTNHAPVASFTASVSSGPAPLTVTFDASATYDPDPGDTLTYSWDLNGDQVCGDASGPTATATYTAASTNVSLCVGDQHGAVSFATQTIRVTAAAGPTVSAVGVSPGLIAVGPRGATVTVSARVVAPAGAASVMGNLIAPDGTVRSARLSLASGTAAAGTWSGSVALPSGGPTETYRSMVTATDVQGRSASSSGGSVGVRQQICIFVFCF